MDKNVAIKYVMTKEVIVANVSNKFSQLMEFFNTYRIQHLPVTLGDRLVGILSINDLLSFVFNNMHSGGQVDNDMLDAKFDMQAVMTKDPISISPEDTVGKAFNILAEGRFQALPIVEREKLVGIITNKDLVRVLQKAL